MMYLVFVNELAGLTAGAPRVSQSDNQSIVVVVSVNVSVKQSPVKSRRVRGVLVIVFLF